MINTDFNSPGAIEFYSIDGITLEFIRDCRRCVFTPDCKDEIELLENDIKNYPFFISEMRRVGITDRFEQLKRFGICYHGDLNFIPDFKDGIRNDSEFYCCDKYETCKLRHKPCSRISAEYGIITRSEIEVIKAVALQLTDQEIGNKLFKSVHTIKSHIQSILSKTGHVTKVGIVIFGLKRGIIDINKL